MALDRYDKLTEALLKWGMHQPDEHNSFNTNQLAIQHQLTKSDVEQVAEQMYGNGMVDLCAWDGKRCRPIREWPNPRAFWNSREDGGHHRIKTLIPGKKRLLELQRTNTEPTQAFLPERLYLEQIENFAKLREVSPAAVRDRLRDGFLDVSEEQVQVTIEEILHEPMHKKDWGGEQNDLYTNNVFVNGSRISAAFLLKGNGLRKKVMQIADCGKNGDQLVRLFQSPAQLFVVQFVGNISESVITDIEGKARGLRSMGRQVSYCTINGQDTARLLHAHGDL